MKDVVNILFSKELDFITKLFIVLVFLSFVSLVIYLLLPMSLRRKVEFLDYQPQGGSSFSVSGISSILILVGLGIFKAQKLSVTKTEEEK